MKTLLSFCLCAIGLAVAAFAGETGNTTPAATAAKHQQALQRARTAIIDQQLNLTDDQKTKVKVLRTQSAAAIKAIRENSALTPEQKREQVAAADKTAREQWRALLTQDQLVKLGQITSHPRELNALALRRVRTAAVAKEIGITPEQQVSLRAIQTKAATTAKAIRADASLSPEQKTAKLRALFQADRTEKRAVLTAEQRQKLERIRTRLLTPLGPLA